MREREEWRSEGERKEGVREREERRVCGREERRE